MVFNFREAIGGFKHLGLKWTRLLANRPDSYFIADYAQRGILVERFVHPNGTSAICPICGYAMIRLQMTNGWLLETCSAMPILSGLGTKEFERWSQSLSAPKLPTAHV